MVCSGPFLRTQYQDRSRITGNAEVTCKAKPSFRVADNRERPDARLRRPDSLDAHQSCHPECNAS